MSNPQSPDLQKNVPRYPPGLPTTPGGAVILQPATQTPPPFQNDIAEQARAGDVAAFIGNLTPMVIHDTFDSVDYDQARAISTPPLTQRPRNNQPLVDNANAHADEPGPMGEGVDGVPQAFVHPAAQDALPAASNVLLPPNWLDHSRSQWGSAQTLYDSTPLNFSFTSSETESVSPLISLSPSPTIRVTRPRSRAPACHPSLSLAGGDHGHDQDARHAANRHDEATSALNANGGNSSDNGTDYFAYFPTPPIIDPPHYTEHVLQGAQRAPDENHDAMISRHAEHPEGTRFTRQLLLDGDPGAFFRGEHTPNPSHAEHAGNPKKRLWPGSPNPEEVQRGLNRPRPANTTPALVGGRRLPDLEESPANPWESARSERADVVCDGLSTLGLAFAPATVSTPALPVRSLTGQFSMARLVPPTTSNHARHQPSAHPLRDSERRLGRPHARVSTDDDDADEPPPGADDWEHVSEPQSQAPKPDKGKGKARAPPQVSDSEEEAADPPSANGGGWSEAEILEARQRSLKTALEDRAGSRRSAFAPQTPQTHGAGPSGQRSSPRTADERDWRMRDDPSSHPHPRSENTVPRQSRSIRPGPDDLECSQRGRDDAHLSVRRHREFSAFAPLPNTRAAQYIRDNASRARRRTSPPLPQRSPFSHIANLQNANPFPSQRGRQWQGSHPYGENIPPSPAPRPWQNTRDDEEMLYEEDEFQNDNSRTYEDWSEEDGELLPSALHGDHAGAHLEPTGVPEGGFPVIHHDDPEARFRGMAGEWIREMWTDPVDSVVFIDVYNYRYTEEDALNRRVEGNLRRSMEHITGETGFDVVPPELEDGVRARARDLPTTWAIRNLTPEGVARALARRTWSFPHISFHTSPRSTNMTRWVMMLEGFLNDNEHNIRMAVSRVLEEPEMMEWMRRMVAVNPDFTGWPVDRAVTAVMRTLRIETLQQGNGNYITNVFIRSPTRDLREWRRWIASLRARRYRSFANGTGRVRYTAACPGCRSAGMGRSQAKEYSANTCRRTITSWQESRMEDAVPPAHDHPRTRATGAAEAHRGETANRRTPQALPDAVETDAVLVRAEVQAEVSTYAQKAWLLGTTGKTNWQT
ncbi:hypothetical protein C8T65DRAFT_699653 [Cerioporus squamosus]|nr:hypothetical protein C8T65DRAFT_699653 [Cerioporus squamosus]